MIEKLNEAMSHYTPTFLPKIEFFLNQTQTQPCTACQKNIDLIHTHPDYVAKKPNELNVSVDSTFTLVFDHLERISQHDGMPAATTSDICPTCFTTFDTHFSGFDEDVHYSYRLLSVATIKDCMTFLSRQKKISLKAFDSFLNRYFAASTETVTIYASLDEQLKRSNHDYLLSYYAKNQKDIKELDRVTCCLTEEEIFTRNCIGGLYKNEFIQAIECPLNTLSFAYSTYHEKIQTTFMTSNVLSNVFFDIETKHFVSFDQINQEQIHPIKRNHDTYAYCDERKKKNNATSTNVIHAMFDQFFSELEQTLLGKKFGSAYTKYKSDLRKKEQEEKAFYASIKEHFAHIGNTHKKEELPTTLHGIGTFDNVLVNQTPYLNMKACVKYIDFQKEQLHVVFFGEQNDENVLHVQVKNCQKL